MIYSPEADKLTHKMSGIVKSFSSMLGCRLGGALSVAAACLFVLPAAAIVHAQQPDAAAVIRQIDALTMARYDSIAGYTVTEYYAVFRGKDETQPVAEMTVKTTYQRESGKSYAIVSESGPELIRKLGLHPLLDNEKSISLPGKVQQSWFTSANYEMTLMPGRPRQMNGRECLAVAITPKRKAPNLIVGTLWVDAKDDSIVEIEGIGSKSPSIWTGPTQLMRQYTNMNGFAMATHARAVANSFLLGQTVVTIDYRDYHIQLRPAK
jgi:hypothetical protein